MKKIIFQGAATALVTPMQEDGSIHFTELGRMIEAQIAGGIDAILICGTTGESATLTDEEKLACIEYTVKAVNRRVPVIAGTGSNNTQHSITLSRRAAALGVDALLLVTPYYNKTSQEGLQAHFVAIADAVACPIILYNVPSRTGVNMLPETVYALSKHPNIVAIKEASGNIAQCTKISSLCGDEITLYSGNDDQVLPLLALGGKGVISVVSNVAPRQMHDLCQTWFDGDREDARKRQLELLPLCSALFSDVNPIPVKYAMSLMHWKVGRCRLPLIEPSPEKKALIRTTMQNSHLME